MGKRGKILIFVTDFWTVEAPFLIPEINILSSVFNKVTIVNTNRDYTKENRLQNPNDFHLKNTEFLDFNLKSNLLSNIFTLTSIFFKSYFYREINFIYKRYGSINFSMIKDIFNYYKNAILLNLKIKKNLNYTDYDIFYSYWLDFTSFAIVIGDFSGVKTISRAHNWDVYFERRGNNYLPFRTAILNRLDGFFPISQNANDYIQKITNNKGSNFFTSRLGVNSAIKSKVQSYESDFTILSLSYITTVKRVDLIVESLSVLNTDTIIKWIHIGPCDFFDEFLNFVKSKLDDKNNIQYELKGFLTTHEVSEFLSKTKIDLHINLSSYEGIPMSIMEVMSYGIPALATDTGGSSEIVNMKNGILIDVHSSPKFISEKILEFKNLTDQKKLLIQNEAYQTWSKKFDSEKNYSEFAEKLICLK